ncbi:MAG: hypothetical protein R2911_35075 [Caldilineaceae bacterium]
MTPVSATRGYLAGALPAGQWTVQIDTHLVLPDVAVEYALEVAVETEQGAAMAPAARGCPISRA